MRFFGDKRMRAFSRHVFLAFLVPYCIVTVAVPLADALLEAEAQHFTEHVEHEGAPRAFAHDELTCPLCLFITLAASTQSDALQLLDPTDSYTAYPTIGEGQLRSASHASSLGARAPPLS